MRFRFGTCCVFRFGLYDPFVDPIVGRGDHHQHDHNYEYEYDGS